MQHFSQARTERPRHKISKHHTLFFALRYAHPCYAERSRQFEGKIFPQEFYFDADCAGSPTRVLSRASSASFNSGGFTPLARSVPA